MSIAGLRGKVARLEQRDQAAATPNRRQLDWAALAAGRLAWADGTPVELPEGPCPIEARIAAAAAGGEVGRPSGPTAGATCRVSPLPGEAGGGGPR